MSKKTEPSLSDRVLTIFREAGGTEADLEWAEDAAFELLWKDVKEPYIEAVMGIAAQTLTEAGEPTRDTFGDAEDWAHGQVEWLKSEGLDAFGSSRGPVPLRVAVANCLWVAAWFSVLLFANALLNLLPGRTQWEFTPVVAALPLMLAALCTLTYGIYAAVRPRQPFGVAVALSALAAVLGIAVSTWFLILVRDSGPEWPWPWMAALVPFYAFLAWGVGRFWPERSGASDDVEHALALSDPDSPEWTLRLQAALRTRDDVTEEKIAAVMHDVRSHLLDSGARPASEFGSPEGYANTVRPDGWLKPRRRAWFYLSLTLLWCVALVAHVVDRQSPLTWGTLAYVFCVAFSAWVTADEFKTWRHLARGGREGRQEG
ncbi:MAG: hypothetical protein ACTII3_04755 [Galactobacter sp.]